MSQVSRMLDDEHRQHLALLGQLEAALARRGDPTLPGLMQRFGEAMARDVERHFAFEEESLFPRLADAGDEGIALLLGEEHAALREVAADLRAPVQAAAEGRLTEADWPQLKRDTLEWVERQVAHIQKETMALLPLLDDLLDDDADRELAFAYAAL